MDSGSMMWARNNGEPMVARGLPKSFTATDEDESALWREQYIATFLERDIPQLGIQIPAATLRRFWTMLCHYHGQVLNLSEFARSFGVAGGLGAQRVQRHAHGLWCARLTHPCKIVFRTNREVVCGQILTRRKSRCVISR